MVAALEDLKENHHVVGVKAEFEAEGTRLEEAMRLKEVVSKAGLDLTIKIGGCEAIKDLYEARVIGVSRIVAPMIETPYALKKFLMAVKIAFSEEERNEVSFLINIETIDGYNNLDRILGIDEIKELDGIVLGRVDLTRSLGLPRSFEDSDRILEISKVICAKVSEKNLECGLGGGISAATIDFIKKIPDNAVKKYETRKIIFKCPEALGKSASEGILKAVGFELMWLKNKRDFYGMIHAEDEQRLNMMEKRYQELIAQAGGVCA